MQPESIHARSSIGLLASAPACSTQFVTTSLDSSFSVSAQAGSMPSAKRSASAARAIPGAAGPPGSVVVRLLIQSPPSPPTPRRSAAHVLVPITQDPTQAAPDRTDAEARPSKARRLPLRAPY